MNCMRHHFSAEVNREIKALHRLDNWHAAAAVGEDFAVIAFAVSLPYLLRSFVPWWISYSFLSVPLIGCRQRALATLLHESAHKTLALNPIWNFVAGSFLSGYLVFQSWHAYHWSHVINHHGHFNDSERDPDLKYLVEQGVYSTQNRTTFVLRYLVAPIFLFRTPGKLLDLIRYRFASSHEPHLGTRCKSHLHCFPRHCVLFQRLRQGGCFVLVGSLSHSFPGYKLVY